MEENALMVLRSGAAKSTDDFKLTMVLKMKSDRSIDFAPLSEAQLFNLEPFAGPEVPIDLGLELFQMEPKCD